MLEVFKFEFVAHLHLNSNDKIKRKGNLKFRINEKPKRAHNPLSSAFRPKRPPACALAPCPISLYTMVHTCRRCLTRSCVHFPLLSLCQPSPASRRDRSRACSLPLTRGPRLSALSPSLACPERTPGTTCPRHASSPQSPRPRPLEAPRTPLTLPPSFAHPREPPTHRRAHAREEPPPFTADPSSFCRRSPPTQARSTANVEAPPCPLPR
jgi:hypothetical protein